MRRFAMMISLAGLMSFTAIAQAAETVSYTYDARGRLKKVTRSGTVNNGVEATYTHDKTGNRSNVKVTGSPNPPPP